MAVVGLRALQVVHHQVAAVRLDRLLEPFDGRQQIRQVIRALGTRYRDATAPQPVRHFGGGSCARVSFFFAIHGFSLTRLRRLARGFRVRRHLALGQLQPCPGESHDQGEKTPARSGIANAE